MLFLVGIYLFIFIECSCVNTLLFWKQKRHDENHKLRDQTLVIFLWFLCVYHGRVSYVISFLSVSLIQSLYSFLFWKLTRFSALQALSWLTTISFRGQAQPDSVESSNEALLVPPPGCIYSLHPRIQNVRTNVLKILPFVKPHKYLG